MEIELLDEILESLLFVSGDGLSVSEIIEMLGLQKSEVTHSVNRLKEKYGGKCGIHLITYNGKIQFGSNPAYVDAVSLVLNPIKEKELSTAALETIAIIAYKQPVTRLEIEQIRGVNCDYAIQVLTKHNLIEVVGRKDVVGKPLLFGTTEAFLKRFQIDSVQQLPDFESLFNSIQVLNDSVQKTEEISMYNEFELKIGDEAAATLSAEGETIQTTDVQLSINDSIIETVKPEQTEKIISSELLTEKTTSSTINSGIEFSQLAAEQVTAINGGVKKSKAAKKETIKDDKFEEEFGEKEIPDFLKGEKDLQHIE